MFKKLVVAASILAGGALANAAITHIQMVPVYQGIISDDLTPETWVDVHDLVVTIEGDDAWAVAGGPQVGVAWATVVGGRFFQHAAGGSTQPNPLFFTVYPALEYDSFYTTHLGWPNTPDQGVAPGFAYGPVEDNLPTCELNADWFWTPDGNDYPGEFTIARFTVVPCNPQCWGVFVAVQVGSLETAPFEFITCTPLTPPVFGDLDCDRDVDLSDLAQLLSNFGTTADATYCDGDLDCDGDVDLNDLAELLSRYGWGSP
jgi:hypothetical protein